jgi:CRP/FNR family cyclic AMP-dependent transcriptional regulator
MNEKTEGWEIRIKEMDLFKDLDFKVMEEIADTACTEVSYDKGTVIFSEGDSANALFFLYEGVVDLKVGGEKTVYSLTEKSDIFGWSSLVANENYTATAIANTDILAIKIDARKLDRVFNANPLFGLEIYRRLSAVFNKRLANIYGLFLSVPSVL